MHHSPLLEQLLMLRVLAEEFASYRNGTVTAGRLPAEHANAYCWFTSMLLALNDVGYVLHSSAVKAKRRVCLNI